MHKFKNEKKKIKWATNVSNILYFIGSHILRMENATYGARLVHNTYRAPCIAHCVKMVRNVPLKLSKLKTIKYVSITILTVEFLLAFFFIFAAILSMSFTQIFGISALWFRKWQYHVGTRRIEITIHCAKPILQFQCVCIVYISNCCLEMFPFH